LVVSSPVVGGTTLPLLARAGFHKKETPDMKNRLIAALVAVLCFTAAHDAIAGGTMRSQRIAWRFPANVTTAPYTQATKALAAGGTDTTVWVGTEGWYVPDINSTDSVVVARFIVFVDSSAAYSPAQTTVTAVIDGATTPIGGGVNPNVNTSSVSITLTPTTGDKLISVPVVIAGTNQLGTVGNWASLPPFIRLRISSSAAMNAAGVSLQYVSPLPN
jgi:uncharacterized membrane protein YeiH